MFGKTGHTKKKKGSGQVNDLMQRGGACFRIDLSPRTAPRVRVDLGGGKNKKSKVGWALSWHNRGEERIAPIKNGTVAKPESGGPDRGETGTRNREAEEENRFVDNKLSNLDEPGVSVRRFTGEGRLGGAEREEKGTKELKTEIKDIKTVGYRCTVVKILPAA